MENKWLLRLIEILPDSDSYSMGVIAFDHEPCTEEINEHVNEVKAPRYELVSKVGDTITVLMEDVSPIRGEYFTIAKSRFFENDKERSLRVEGTLHEKEFVYEVKYDGATYELIDTNTFTDNNEYELANELENLIGHFFINDSYHILNS